MEGFIFMYGCVYVHIELIYIQCITKVSTSLTFL